MEFAFGHVFPAYPAIQLIMNLFVTF